MVAFQPPDDRFDVVMVSDVPRDSMGLSSPISLLRRAPILDPF
jgi:hypothetical protein